MNRSHSKSLLYVFVGRKRKVHVQLFSIIIAAVVRKLKATDISSDDQYLLLILDWNHCPIT